MASFWSMGHAPSRIPWMTIVVSNCELIFLKTVPKMHPNTPFYIENFKKNYEKGHSSFTRPLALWTPSFLLESPSTCGSWLCNGSWQWLRQWFLCQGSYRSRKTGKSWGICVVREKYYFWNVWDHADCRFVWFLVRLQILKSRQICGFRWKLEVFLLQGGFAPWPQTRASVVCILLH